MIEDNCEAWAYGPVFPDIYEKYKTQGNSAILDYDKSIDDSDLFSSDELRVLDYVVECFGIYNGYVLMKLTHKERPWIEARAGIPEFIPSSNIINNETIYNYFDEKNKKYSLHTVDGVNAYIRALGVI